MTSVQDKVAVITGSLGGIGFEIAQSLARQGARIVLNGLGEEVLIQSQLEKIKSLGAQVIYHGADLSKPSEIEDLVKTTLKQFHQIDILVNNAVTRFDAQVDSMPIEKWDYALAVNLSAPFHLSRLVLPGMKERNWGRIINLASIFGVQGMAGRLDYVATKHGLVGMTKVIALECVDYNITCNALCPGAVETDHIKQLVVKRANDQGVSVEDFTNDFLKARQPTRRFVTPAHVAALALFLCSEEARDMTGTPIPMDGGWQARA
jgi:3-hydroxybutyrate dehydrogenase